MESDRMGHLLGVVTQPRLDEQRGVVKNEKRQGENRPYGRVSETVYRASFPPGHPYRTLPIGSMADLDATTLDDVRDWFRTYYGAANAVLVLAGDIDVPTARAKAEQYFGHIAPGPAVSRPGDWIAARPDSRRETLYAQVAQPRWQRYWNTPPDNTRDSEYLGLVDEILGGGKTSRLYERLVYRERLADSIAAGQSPLEIAGLFTLSADVKQGVPVIIATRPGVPVARVSLMFDGGFVGDQGRKPGTASFAMSLLDEGAGKLDSLAIADRAERLGAQIASAAGLDTAFATVSMMTDQADPSLALLADVVRRPTFAVNEIERVRKEWIAGIAREKMSPDALALRVLPPLLYGAGHPYAIPFSGSGTEASVSALTRDDLIAYQRDFLRPDNATIIVTGAVSPATILPLLERHFGDWQPPAGASPPPAAITAAQGSGGTRVYLLDRPGAPQTSILAGQLMRSSLAPDRIDLNTANDVLGGTFTSRINMNLREDKHWSYGARSSLTETRGQRPWLLSAPVQTDKTVESIQEIQRELADFLAAKPITADEVVKIRSRDVRALSGQYETNAAVSGAIGDIVRFGRPDDYVRTLRARLQAQTDAGARQAAAQAFQPGSLTWVIVGDLSKIEAPIRELGLGIVQVLDADGNVLR